MACNHQYTDVSIERIPGIAAWKWEISNVNENTLRELMHGYTIVTQKCDSCGTYRQQRLLGNPLPQPREARQRRWKVVSTKDTGNAEKDLAPSSR